MTGRPRLVAIHAGALGDFVTALPALGPLADIGDLTLVGHGSRIALAPMAIPGVRLVDLEAAAFHTVFATPHPNLVAVVQGADAVLAWFRDDDGALARGLQAAGANRAVAMPGVPHAGWSAHAVDYYHDCVSRFAEACALEVAPPALDSVPALAVADAPRHGAIVLHPGSGSPRKNWPLARFAAVAEGLSAEGYPVAWVLGPAEGDWRLPAGACVVTPADPVALARYLAGGRLAIGNDSGVAHLAAACGCPSLTVFIASDPAVWAPRGAAEHCVVSGAEGAAAPGVAAVLAAARSLLAGPVEVRERAAPSSTGRAGGHGTASE